MFKNIIFSSFFLSEARVEIEKFDWDAEQDWSRGGCISYHQTFKNSTYYDYKWRVSDCKEKMNFVCMYSKSQ